jgi:ApaG protein
VRVYFSGGNSNIATKEPVCMYRAITHGVEVSVSPEYLPGQSNPHEGRHVWAYHVEISNQSSVVLTLMRRHWTIVDQNGNREQVDGEGVIGQQPRLAPGERFAYSSACPLNSPSGMMFGSYAMQQDTGGVVMVNIPAFSLDLPSRSRLAN